MSLSPGWLWMTRSTGREASSRATPPCSEVPHCVLHPSGPSLQVWVIHDARQMLSSASPGGLCRWGLGGGCPLLKQKDKTRGLGPSSHLRFCGLVSYSGYRLLHRMNVLRLNIVGILDKGLKSENRTGRNLLL